MRNNKDRRHEAILDAINNEGLAKVSVLAKMFGVSEMTLRRDLKDLSSRGVISRVHGGATIRQAPQVRAEIMRAEKLAMARWVTKSIQDHQFIGLDVGSTCTAIAQELYGYTNLTVLTNSLEALHVLQGADVERISVAGYVNSEGSIIPHDNCQSLESYVLDKVILGCGGISHLRGITYHEINETFFRRSLIERANEVVLVADHSKLDREIRFSLGSLSLIDTLVTTREPTGELADSLSDARVQVDVVDIDNGSNRNSVDSSKTTACV